MIIFFKFLKKKIKINFLYIFYINFRGSIRTTMGLTKRKRLSGLKDILKFFIIRSIFGLTYFRNKIGIRKSDDIIEDKNFTSILKKNSILESIDLKGHSDLFKLKESLTDNLLLEILTSLKKSSIFYDDKSSEIKKLNFGDKRTIDEYLIKNNIHIIKSKVDLNKTTILKKIFLDNFFTELAKDYLNDDKITINTDFFISNAKNNLNDISKIDRLKSLAAQEYHFDVDFKKFFKIFVYLSDVLEKENGAHTFIPHTHAQKRRENYVTSRWSTYEIEKNYPLKKIFLGEAGTVFMEDTFGIHKGLPVIKKTRLALIIEFGKGHNKIDKDLYFI